MNTATITIRFFGSLRERYATEQTLTISENETIRSIVSKLAIDPHPSYLYAVNGNHARAATELKDGDILMVIPPISGG